MNLSALIDRMISAGVPAAEAGAIAAEIYAAGVASVAGKSPSAIRQQRYRDRKTVTNRNESVTNRNAGNEPNSVTNRNESVTNRNAGNEPNSVTNRNESVTNRNGVMPPSIDIEKDSKKERRGSQLPDGWEPDEVRWIAACRKLGSDGAGRELQKFTSHHRAKGTVFKNWNFGWDKWLLQSAEWKPKQGAAAGVVDPKQVDWRAILESYKRFRNWPRGHGNEPGSPSCRAPPELLSEFGFEPVVTQ